MEEVQKVMDKLGKANKLMERLIDMAMEDEKMSEDEKEILFSINSNLGGYAKRIITAISDGNIDITEMDEIQEIEQKIVEEAKKVAKQDEKISQEEKHLLNELIKVIESI